MSPFIYLLHIVIEFMKKDFLWKVEEIKFDKIN